MFKDIQKQLLLKYPLIWNTKFVPMIGFGLLLHLIFFGLGYLDGTIDFSNKTKFDISVFSVLIGVLLGIIILILWLVNYFKNNSLKSFYNKSKNALFYEWFQIFSISLLLITFYLPFSIGKQWHQKSYFSLEETKKRCEIISTADIFIDGSFASTEIDSVASGLLIGATAVSVDSIVESEEYSENYNYERANGRVFKDYMLFEGKKYDEYSLLNRNIFEFSVFTEKEDSLNERKVKIWLHNNERDKVKNLMSAYLKMLNEHQLKTNLTLDKWFEITYNEPAFNKFLYIIPYIDEYETENYYDYNVSKLKTYANNEEKYSKYYIQQSVLKSKYDIVSDAHTNPFFKYEELLSYLYGALGLSLLIFSFRVTTGKSWLISIVVTGILNIFYGIFSAVTSSGMTYVILILLTILGFGIYYIIILLNRKSIQLSRIALNIFLWSFTTFVPIIYFLIMEAYKYKDYRYRYTYYDSPIYKWLNEHILEMFALNFVFAAIVLFFLSRSIRNWKGLAEE